MKITASDYFKKVEDVSYKYLMAHNITGIALDIDNTIAIDGKTEISPNVIRWLKNIRLPVCLLSNGKERRVKFFADVFGLNYVCRANKPSRKGYTRASKLLGIEDLTKIAVIGDQLFSDILGGNMAGCYTIKIEPIDKATDPFVVKVRRWFERFVT
jgi:HAD superfamily phosphatase (TIGR01668 family)